MRACGCTFYVAYQRQIVEGIGGDDDIADA
jgi:hypothetical protein